MLVPTAEAFGEESGYGVVGSEVVVIGAVLFGVFAVVVFLVAATSILRASYLSGTAQLVWIVGCLLAPVLVPTLWFTVGRTEMQRRAAQGDG